MHWVLYSLCACAVLEVSSGLHTGERREFSAQQPDQFEDEHELMLQWEIYKDKYQKQYEDEEEERHRLTVYRENGRRVAEHNALHARGLATYTMELNQFADITHQEFIETVTMGPLTIEEEEYDSVFRWNRSIGQLPQETDWRSKGAVTPVKDQRKCLSCWAFSATGSLEGQHYLKTGKLVSLSEQNLVDCSTSYGNSACSGGYVAKSYKYIEMNGGIDTEYSYPYEAKANICRYNREKRGAWDAGSVHVARGEGHLQAAVARHGPIATYMDASQLQFYNSGVFYNRTCSSRSPNHAVLVVGYGRDVVGGLYWLVKNSWGSFWGEKGYFRIARNRRNLCGIASNAVYPLL